jgi:hypothetical protein
MPNVMLGVCLFVFPTHFVQGDGKCTIGSNNIKKIPAQKWESTIAKGCLGFELLMMFLATLDKGLATRLIFGWTPRRELGGKVGDTTR